MGASFERVFWYAGSLIISKSYLAMRSLIFQIFGTDLTTIFFSLPNFFYSLSSTYFQVSKSILIRKIQKIQAFILIKILFYGGLLFSAQNIMMSFFSTL